VQLEGQVQDWKFEKGGGSGLGGARAEEKWKKGARETVWEQWRLGGFGGLLGRESARQKAEIWELAKGRLFGFAETLGKGDAGALT